MKNRIATWLAACLVFGAPASALGLASAVAERAARAVGGRTAADAARGMAKAAKGTTVSTAARVKEAARGAMLST